MEEKAVIQVNGKSIHLVLYKTLREWNKLAKYNENLWNFPLEELLDGAIEPDEGIWYWLISGRCYETTEEVMDE